MPNTLTFEERRALRRLVSDRRRELIPDGGMDMEAALQHRVARMAEQQPTAGRKRVPYRRKAAQVRDAITSSPRDVEAMNLAGALASAAAALELSIREVQVLSFVATGLTTEETAERLLLSASTVKQTLGEVFWKLGARDRTHAVAIVLSNFARSAIEPSTDADVA